MNLRHLPNAITGLRLAMAPVLLWLLWAGFYRDALWVALVAGASDAVDGLLPEAQRRQVGHIHTAGQQLLGLLDQSLEYARRESRPLNLRPQPSLWRVSMNS